ncbi:nicotinate-nucleotide adenylyltransferase [Maritalea porphyrae]|uniref:nicotinate-nucleotide adenylyltransferase n=1 Tax=Maritalea porphyrae TaxID=880732 RepID=UPI0022AE6DCF|nr:nicotinate-nucleotide adenylyltransferase [Maritalea porphyrae]MCZ4271657.1 nicotinate-nucleotide adenylyltransferase [Maritalea porphyrae]
MSTVFLDNARTDRLPHSAPGMRIGLFGGSFNPPHDGHRLVSRQAMKRLGLDAVWWLVSPGNPLKDHSELAPLQERIDAACKLVDHPAVRITGFEAEHGFRYTYDTLEYLTKSLPDRKFVWIMGADNLVGFHKWERWRDIARMMPIAIYVRPGTARRAPFSRAATALSAYRVDETDARKLANMQAPAWMYMHGIMSELSSTQIRNGKKSVSSAG